MEGYADAVKSVPILWFERDDVRLFGSFMESSVPGTTRPEQRDHQCQ